MGNTVHPLLPKVAVSVVSHGHGVQVLCLLRKLDALCLRHVAHVLLTINVPEPDLARQLNRQTWNFSLTVIQNHEPKGFGANHNAAFKQGGLDYFSVLNPDIDFDEDPFLESISHFERPLVGCVFPVQLDEAGHIQDFARQLPSPSSLFARYMGLKRKKQAAGTPDWVNGAFMVFPTKIFEQLNGFDERYFMYCEDVDICLRLQLAGYRLSQARARVTHAAHRNSRVNLRHLAWHMTSLLRLWLSDAYRQFYRIRPTK